MKKALIFGVTGQDGSYLTEILLEKGYEVHGVKRRSSSYNTSRIDHIYNNKSFKLHYGDITDSLNVTGLIQEIKPDEIYNLAAQSHVKVSFEIPEYTGNVDALGTLRILESIRLLGMENKVKFYQASTSELYGLVQETPQTEKTPFYPRSPYACAKLAGFWYVKNYREAYSIFACNGILFNHECFFANTPVILKKNDNIFIDYINNLIPNRSGEDHDESELIKDYCGRGFQIWDGNEFVELKTVSRKYITKLNKDDRKKRLINSRSGSVITTPNHNMFDSEENKLQSKQLSVGDKVLTGKFPLSSKNIKITKEFSFVLGMLCGDGYVSEGGKIGLSNIKEENLELFERNFSVISPSIYFRRYNGSSGFGGISGGSSVSGVGANFGKYIREMIYDKRSKHKKIPNEILNAEEEIQYEFLRGYNIRDGLTSAKYPCKYEFKRFSTNSPLLAQGLIYLIYNVTKQTWNVNTFMENGKPFYKINFHSPYNIGAKGKHFTKPSNEISKIVEEETSFQHVYNIETASGKVMAGVGKMVVSNSPRRGETFVTQKIVMGLNSINKGTSDCLYLGNLNSLRDWGHAKDYSEAMYLMLQQETSDDYVIATGKQYSVRQFVESCAPYFNMNIKWEGTGLEEVGVDTNSGNVVIRVDPKYFRPAEVETLLGDSTKARTVLGWKPKYDFNGLVKEMCEYELQR